MHPVGGGPAGDLDGQLYLPLGLQDTRAAAHGEPANLVETQVGFVLLLHYKHLLQAGNEEIHPLARLELKTSVYMFLVHFELQPFDGAGEIFYEDNLCWDGLRVLTYDIQQLRDLDINTTMLPGTDRRSALSVLYGRTTSTWLCSDFW